MPISRKRPPARSVDEALGDELAGQGVEDDIDALAVRESHHLFCEVQRPGIHDVLNALRFEELAFLGGSGGREHLGADLSGQSAARLVRRRRRRHESGRARLYSTGRDGAAHSRRS